jgi:hypothetical protein
LGLGLPLGGVGRGRLYFDDAVGPPPRPGEGSPRGPCPSPGRTEHARSEPIDCRVGECSGRGVRRGAEGRGCLAGVLPRTGLDVRPSIINSRGSCVRPGRAPRHAPATRPPRACHAPASPVSRDVTCRDVTKRDETRRGGLGLASVPSGCVVGVTFGSRCGSVRLSARLGLVFGSARMWRG